MNGYRKVVNDPLGFLIGDLTKTGMRLPAAVDRAAQVIGARTRQARTRYGGDPGEQHGGGDPMVS